MKPNASFLNEVTIEGYVFSTGKDFSQLSERISGPNSKNPGTKYIAGDLNIAVDEAGLNVVTVHYRYVAEKFGNEKKNSTYTVLKKIIDNPDKTWIEGGKENAFKVQCTKVSIAVNDFIAGDGTKVAALRNEGGFCSIVNELCIEEDRSFFATDMLITKVTHVDADPEKGIDEDYANLSGCVFGYGNVLIPATFAIRDPQGVQYFENLDITPSNPTFTKVTGTIISKTIKVQKEEESAWGGTMIKTVSKKQKEYLVTRSAKVPYDFGNEDVLTANDVNAMNQDRQIMLAEVEKRHQESKAKKAAQTAFNAGTPNSTPASDPTQNIAVGNFNF